MGAAAIFASLIVAVLALGAIYFYMKKGHGPKVGTACSGANGCGAGGQLACDTATGKCVAASGVV